MSIEMMMTEVKDMGAIKMPENAGAARITVALDREQLRQAMEGLGHRLEHMLAHRRDYVPEEIDAARSALDVLAAAEFSATSTFIER